jgi:hypothetical protein
MTSDVERVVGQKFIFHCSCGANIETAEKKQACWSCGETTEVRQCIATPDGEKYVLRVSRGRQRLNAEPYLFPRSRSTRRELSADCGDPTVFAQVRRRRQTRNIEPHLVAQELRQPLLVLAGLFHGLLMVLVIGGVWALLP